MTINRQLPKITILGSGHSGHALAATFSAARYPTTMVSLTRHSNGLINLNEHKGVYLKSKKIKGFFPVNCTDDLLQSIANANIIFCTVPAFYHEEIIEKILPALNNGQFINFSSYFGALKMLKHIQARPELNDITILETMSAIHASRSTNYGEVEILSMKDEVPVSAYPHQNIKKFIKLVRKALPCISEAKSILDTSLNNVGPILHVPLMLFNAAHIEATQGKGWNLYQHGMTFAVQEYIKQLDNDRLKIANELGCFALKAEDIMLNIFYKLQSRKAKNFWQWIRSNNIHANKTVGTPNAINTRYLTEGIYYGLLPMQRIAKQFNIDVPIIDNTISVSDTLLKFYDAPTRYNLNYVCPYLIKHLMPLQKAA